MNLALCSDNKINYSEKAFLKVWSFFLYLFCFFCATVHEIVQKEFPLLELRGKVKTPWLVTAESTSGLF